MTDYRLTLTVDDGAEAALRVDDDIGLGLEIGDTYIRGEGRPYEGAYEVTPTQYAQILPTSGTELSQDVIVNPIPSNYGLITWNGSVLRVS